MKTRIWALGIALLLTSLAVMEGTTFWGQKRSFTEAASYRPAADNVAQRDPTVSGYGLSAVPSVIQQATETASLDADSLKQTSWWAQVQESIRRSEYDVRKREDSADGTEAKGLHAFNRAQSLHARFDQSGARVTERGGALLAASSSPTLVNCTFNGNSASVNRGAIACEGGNPVAVNCILWGDARGEIASGGGSLSVSFCDIQAGYPAASGNINLEPAFADAIPGDLRLLAGSPCTDAGTASNAPQTDISGVARPQEKGIDLGAYEFPQVWYVDKDQAFQPGDGRSWDTAFRRVQEGVDAASADAGGEVWVAEGVYQEVEFTGEVLFDDFESGDLSKAPWRDGTGSVSPWFVDNSGPSSGTYAARSGAIVDGQTSILELTADLGAQTARFSFSFKISSESGFDYLIFMVDGVEQGRWSGELPWQEVSFPLVPGSHVFTWTYSKDVSVSAGSDCAWIDEVWARSFTQLDALVTMREGVHLYGGFVGIPSQSSESQDGYEVDRSQRDWYAHPTTLDAWEACRCVVGANASTLDGFIVTGGHADFGGGMFNFHASPAVANCTFTGNAAQLGAGMYNQESSPRIMDCFFLQNQQGGGMTNCTSSPTVTNCVFSGNCGGWGGSGIYDYSGSIATVVNCTLYGNLGGYAALYSELDSSATIMNSIVWANDNGGVFGPVTAVYSDVQGSVSGEGNIVAQPWLLAPEANDFRLDRDSPCIDAGRVLGSPPADIVGVPRPVGNGVDMGAFEFIAVPEVDTDGDGLPDDQEARLGCDPQRADAALFATIDYPSDGASLKESSILLSGRIASAYVNAVTVSTDGGASFPATATISGLTWRYRWVLPFPGDYHIEVRAYNVFGGFYTTAGPILVSYWPNRSEAVITWPVSGQHVSGMVFPSVSILPSRTGNDSYVLDYRAGADGEASGEWVQLATGNTTQDGGVQPLPGWDVSLLPDGRYTMRLRVADTTGHTTVATSVLVYVDNDVTPPEPARRLHIEDSERTPVTAGGRVIRLTGMAEPGTAVYAAQITDQSGMTLADENGNPIDITQYVTVHANGAVSGSFRLPDYFNYFSNGGFISVQLWLRDAVGNVSSLPALSNPLPVDAGGLDVSIWNPTDGATLPRNLIAVSGYASDWGGSGIWMVEVTTDGVNYELASGGESWMYYWCPPQDGEYTLYVRATDIFGNTGAVPSAASATIFPSGATSLTVAVGILRSPHET